MFELSRQNAKRTGWVPALLMLGCAFAPGQVAAQQQVPDLGAEFDHVYVFGDSLSDNGNISIATDGAIPTSPPYAPGRFSNGPMWVDLVFDDLKPLLVDPNAPSRSFAAGGARTDDSFDLEGRVPPGILAQLQLFRLNRIATKTSVGPHDLVTVWAGANNIFDAFSYIRRHPTEFPDQNSVRAYLLATSDSAVADLEEAIQSLIEIGATKILVPGAPDLGRVPRFNRDPVRSAQATLASDRFNDGLASVLENLSAQADGSVDIVSMDVDRLFEVVALRPRDFGLGNVADACINQVAEVDQATLTVCSPDLARQNDYLFWDEIHPTGATHEIIARTVIGLLTADQAFQTPMTFSESGLIAARALSRDVSQRLAAVRAPTPAPASSDAVSHNGRVSLFLSGSHGRGDRSASGFARGLNYDLQTFSAGADGRLGDKAVAGVAIGYVKSDNNLTDGSSFGVTAWQGSAFATYFTNGFHADASLARGWLEIGDYVRPTTLAPIRARGRTSGNYLAATANTGYVHKTGNVALGADAGLRYTDVEIDGFVEEDAPILGLAVDEQHATSLTALASAQVSGDIATGSWRITPYARVTYEAELDGRRRGSGRLIDNTANPILVDDKLLDDNSMQFDAGVVATGNSIRISVDYLHRWGIRSGGKDKQLSARVAWSF